MIKLSREAQDILLVLHDRISKHNSDWWSFASAFTAAGISGYETKREEIFGLLSRQGFIRADGDFETGLRKKTGGIDTVPDTPVTVTDRGRAEAIRITIDREPKTMLDRLHSVNWATWGGLAAIFAAIASSIGAYFAFEAIS